MHKATKLGAMLLLFALSFGTTGAVAGANEDTCFSLNSTEYLQDDYALIAIKACTALIQSTSGNEQAAAWNADGTRHDKKTFNDKVGALDAARTIARTALPRR